MIDIDDVEVQQCQNSIAEQHEIPKNQTQILYINGYQPGMVQELALCLSPPEGTVIEQAVWFDFTASNNEYEYEALIVGMKKAKLIDVQNLVYSL